MNVKIVIKGAPIPWAAPRVTRHLTYDNKREDKASARWQIRSQYRDQPIEGPVMLMFQFYMPIPKGTSKKKSYLMIQNEIMHCKKPDLTNLIKLAEDCLKGIVIKDDSQVTSMGASKAYGEDPRTEIIVYYD